MILPVTRTVPGNKLSLQVGCNKRLIACKENLVFESCLPFDLNAHLFNLLEEKSTTRTEERKASRSVVTFRCFSYRLKRAKYGIK